MNTIIIPDALQDVVALVSEKLGYTVNFRFGTYAELVDDLRSIDYTSTPEDITEDRNYPLIWLPMDIDEVFSGSDYSYTATIKLILCTQTQKELRTSERYNTTFLGILYPIYDELLNQIARCGWFEQGEPEQIEHTKTDRMYWGKTQLIDENGVGIDFVDAIEISNLKLNVKFNNCKRLWPN